MQEKKKKLNGKKNELRQIQGYVQRIRHDWRPSHTSFARSCFGLRFRRVCRVTRIGKDTPSFEFLMLRSSAATKLTRKSGGSYSSIQRLISKAKITVCCCFLLLFPSNLFNLKTYLHTQVTKTIKKNTNILL